MTGAYVASIDQGTASSRCMLFDGRGRIVSVAQKEHRQLFPRPGWVEHDPEEILANVLEVVRDSLGKAGLGLSDLVALGIANQRETTIVWERDSGRPVYNAISWQDTRTDKIVDALAREGGKDRFRAQTGLPLTTYFSGPKIRWILDHVEGRPRRCREGRRALRHHGHLADLEADRPPRDRRHQCQPDHADGPQSPGTGTTSCSRR